MGSKYLAVIFFPILQACTGPLSPFGAVNRLRGGSEQSHEGIPLPPAAAAGPITVEFIPDRQSLHRTKDLTIFIRAAAPIADTNFFVLLYQGRDVTDAVMKNSAIVLSPDRKLIGITFPRLALTSFEIHDITLTVREKADNRLRSVAFEAPTCSLFAPPSDTMSNGTDGFPDSPPNLAREGDHPSRVNSALMAAIDGEKDEFRWNLKDWLHPDRWYGRGAGLTAARSTSQLADEISKASHYWTERLRADSGAFASRDLSNDVFDLALASVRLGPKPVVEAVTERLDRWRSARELSWTLAYIRRVASRCYSISKGDV